MLNKIKMIFRTNWINTLRFNFHYFGIKGLKFRCLLAHHVKLDKLKGKFIIQDDTRLRLGYWNNFSEEGCHKHLKFYNDGLIQVGGGGQLTLTKVVQYL